MNTSASIKGETPRLAELGHGDRDRLAAANLIAVGEHLQSRAGTHAVVGQGERDPAGIAVVGDFAAGAVPQGPPDLATVRCDGDEAIGDAPVSVVVRVGHPPLY